MDDFEDVAPPELEEVDVDLLIADEEENRLEAQSSLPSLETVSRKRRYIEDDDIDEALDYAQLEAIEASLPPQSLSAEQDRKLREERALQCVECKALAYNVPYYKAFKIAVCNQCQNEFPTKYKLITKTTAKTEYLCTESDLTKLPLMLKPNPKEHRTTMKLYRMYDILPIALTKFPSVNQCPETSDITDPALLDQTRMAELESAITAEKDRRELERLNRDVAKRQKVRQAALKEERVRSFDVKAAQKRKAGHKHTFESSGGKQKCSECGFELEFEEF